MPVKPVFSKVDYGLYRGVIVYFLKLIKNYIKKKFQKFNGLYVFHVVLCCRGSFIYYVHKMPEKTTIIRVRIRG